MYVFLYVYKNAITHMQKNLKEIWGNLLLEEIVKAISFTF